MRVNVYAEELTDRIEIVEKGGHTGLRFWLALPASFHVKPGSGEVVAADPADTIQAKQLQAPFIHHPGDDDSGAVTFWGKRQLRILLKQALQKLDDYYALVDAPEEIQSWKITNRRGKPCVEGYAFSLTPGSTQMRHVYIRAYDPLAGIVECAETGKKYRLT